ncbi:MAG: methyltransferase domain-containing protein [Paracoccaceae bacterium]|nr:methyltransferase domain-containing protein [Paracoccaceae bacterium]
MRLRPALDLLAQVGDLPQGDIVDLCCGDGAVGPALGARFSGRAVVGLDASPAMLDKARGTGVYQRLILADLRDWDPETRPALIFSNAALHWLPDHATLLPRLAAMLAPGGVLAVQMPRQWGAPSHRFLRDIAASLFSDRFDVSTPAPVSGAVHYWEMLAPLGRVAAWETEYVQRLDARAAGHPVRGFTEPTAMRPFLEKLDAAEAAAFVAAYDAALAAAYPLLPDGAALMPFRRVFFTLQV